MVSLPVLAIQTKFVLLSLRCNHTKHIVCSLKANENILQQFACRSKVFILAGKHSKETAKASASFPICFCQKMAENGQPSKIQDRNFVWIKLRANDKWNMKLTCGFGGFPVKYLTNTVLNRNRTCSFPQCSSVNPTWPCHM